MFDKGMSTKRINKNFVELLTNQQQIFDLSEQQIFDLSEQQIFDLSEVY